MVSMSFCWYSTISPVDEYMVLVVWSRGVRMGTFKSSDWFFETVPVVTTCTVLIYFPEELLFI